MTDSPMDPAAPWPAVIVSVTTARSTSRSVSEEILVFLRKLFAVFIPLSFLGSGRGAEKLLGEVLFDLSNELELEAAVDGINDFKLDEAEYPAQDLMRIRPLKFDA